MRNLFQDVRYGLRTLLGSPGFTLAAVLCLALGIGATTAIFSVVNGVLLKPLPYKEPARLVRLYTEFPTFPNGGLRRFWTSPPEYDELKRSLTSWVAMEAWTTGGANLAGGGASEPIRIQSVNVTGGLIEALGVRPVMGRNLTDADDKPGATRVALISHGLWQRAFGSDRNIVGREVQLNGRACQIAGVMPAGFQFPPGEIEPADLWTPLQLGPPDPQRRGNHFLNLLGRLKPGVSQQQALDEMSRHSAAVAAAAGPKEHRFNPKNHPLVAFSLHDETIGPVKRAILMLLGAVGFVLLIACVNVANLLLARAEGRQREIAIRRAIGAGGLRLARQFVTEGVLLAGLGALVGLGLAYAGLRLLTAAGKDTIPRAAEIQMDTTVLGVTLGLSLLTGIFFGLAPLLQLGGRDLHDALKSAAGRTTATVSAGYFRNSLVVTELALALVLLIGNGLMIRAFWKLLEVRSGVDASNVLTMRIALPNATYPDSKSAVRFWNDLDQRVGTLPGVVGAAMVSGLPPNRPINANDTKIEGFVQKEGGPLQNIDYYQIVGHGYFGAMGVRLMEGRLFDDRDGEGSNPVVVINKTMAQIYWPDSSALGRRVQPSFQGPFYSVIGVVDDVKNGGLDKPAGTEIYFSARQLAGGNFAPRGGTFVVKTKDDPLAMTQAIRAQVRAVDASIPVSAVRSMEDVMQSAQARPRFLTLLMSLFSGVAVTLAALGIFGVISYSVARRTNEFGVRMALGARTGDVLLQVLRQGLLLGAIGATIGVAGALGLSRYLKDLLFGVSAMDPLTFGLMAVVLLGVTVAACLIPARRATKVDPLIALRYE